MSSGAGSNRFKGRKRGKEITPPTTRALPTNPWADFPPALGDYSDYTFTRWQNGPAGPPLSAFNLNDMEARLVEYTDKRCRALEHRIKSLEKENKRLKRSANDMPHQANG